MGDSYHKLPQQEQQLINIKKEARRRKIYTMTNQMENNQLKNGERVTSVSEKMKKFNKKVTWSNQLTSVKIMTPELVTLDKKFKLFPFREEEEDRFLAELNLL